MYRWGFTRTGRSDSSREEERCMSLSRSVSADERQEEGEKERSES
jgi:hypothetical protein